MTVTSIILPVLLLAYLASTHFEYGRDNPLEDAGKVRIPKTGGGTAKMWAIDNQLNEYMAVTIAREQEWFLKFILQAGTVVAIGLLFSN